MTPRQKLAWLLTETVYILAAASLVWLALVIVGKL